MRMVVPTVDNMQDFGALLAQAAEPGDLILLNGPLGAGKTTLTQGIARGMGVQRTVASPTFTIAQIYSGSTFDLIHVDAYRLESIEELDALDLDASLEDSLTVVEWGAGKVEVLSDSRLEIAIERPVGSAAGEEPDDLFTDAPRILTLTPVGTRGTALHDRLIRLPGMELFRATDEEGTEK